MKPSIAVIGIFCLVFSFLVVGTLDAQDSDEEGRIRLQDVQWRGFGAGIVLGEPTGLTAKVWMGERSALDAAAAWSFVGDGSLYVHGSYHYHLSSPVGIEEGELLPYVGVGGKVLFADDPEFGIRVPLGAGYFFETVPIELFLELAPGLQLYPATSADFTGGIGGRYYFRPRE
ncbi:MAG: hypothetical protein ACLFPV_10605 [Spirochaetaceae bacterium]